MNLDNSDPATKGDLLELESRMDTRIDSLESRIDARIEARIDASEVRILERMEAMETRLLTAFHQWAVPINGRLRKLEAGDGLLNERLAMIEERIFTIEKRIGPPPQRP